MTAAIETEIERLRRVFDAQKAAVSRSPVPSLDERLDRLAQLGRMLIAHRQSFRDALATDFGSHHPWMSDMLETGSVLGRIRHIERHLGEWAKPHSVPLEAAHGSSTAEIIHLPKGVNGIIAPWNFPIDCSLVMVADLFAAGNTPSSNRRSSRRQPRGRSTRLSPGTSNPPCSRSSRVGPTWPRPSPRCTGITSRSRATLAWGGS